MINEKNRLLNFFNRANYTIIKILEQKKIPFCIEAQKNSWDDIILFSGIGYAKQRQIINPNNISSNICDEAYDNAARNIVNKIILFCNENNIMPRLVKIYRSFGFDDIINCRECVDLIGDKKTLEVRICVNIKILTVNKPHH